jgi:hypothetical protein
MLHITEIKCSHALKGPYLQTIPRMAPCLFLLLQGSLCNVQAPELADIISEFITNDLHRQLSKVPIFLIKYAELTWALNIAVTFYGELDVCFISPSLSSRFTPNIPSLGRFMTLCGAFSVNSQKAVRLLPCSTNMLFGSTPQA